MAELIDFEKLDRDAWQMPERVLSTLAPFRSALDVGAGTGYFTEHLARVCRTVAVEPEAAFRSVLRRRGFDAVPSLREVRGRFDLVLLVGVLRYVDLSAIPPVLHAEGRVAIVDWRSRAPRGPPERIDPAAAIEAAARAGLRPIGEHDFLPHQWFLVLALDSQRP